MNDGHSRICDDCPEHSEVKKVQANRDLEQQKQWDKIQDVEKCANTAKRVAAAKVGPMFVIVALGIVVSVCVAGFTLLYNQNHDIGTKIQNVKERVIAIETKLAEHDKYEGRSGK